MSGQIVVCANCDRDLYRVNKLEFPLDYRRFVPLLDGVDPVYEDPICPFCDHPFQVVPLDINWGKINLQPVKTKNGIFRYAEPPPAVSFEKPKEEVKGPVCACGCGQPVKKQGTYISNMHKMRGIIKPQEVAT